MIPKIAYVEAKAYQCNTQKSYTEWCFFVRFSALVRNAKLPKKANPTKRK